MPCALFPSCPQGFKAQKGLSHICLTVVVMASPLLVFSNVYLLRLKDHVLSVHALGYSCSTKGPRCAWGRMNQACPHLNHVHPLRGEETEVLRVSAPHGQSAAVFRLRQYFSNGLKTESVDRG